MKFEDALTLMKEGKCVRREGWNNTEIVVFAQYPDEHSFNTEPYLIMQKGDKRFPLDLSCESIFAEDWTLTERPMNLMKK